MNQLEYALVVVSSNVLCNMQSVWLNPCTAYSCFVFYQGCHTHLSVHHVKQDFTMTRTHKEGNCYILNIIYHSLL